MSEQILPFTVVLDDSSQIGPSWTLDNALDVARGCEKGAGGRKVIRITRGTEIVLEGDALRGRLDELG